MAATIFASNVFFDWQDERAITSLKTISKPVNELDFPSVTICKDGQNLQAVGEMLERDRKTWKGKRKKRELSGSDPESSYCQSKFNRTCEQVVFSFRFGLRIVSPLRLHCNIFFYSLLFDQVVDIVRALASRNIEESIGSFALHIYAACGTTVHSTPSLAPPAVLVRKKRESESSSGESESEESESEESESEESESEESESEESEGEESESEESDGKESECLESKT